MLESVSYVRPKLTNVVNRTSSVLMDDLTYFFVVFINRLGDGRSERWKFSTSLATFERKYHPKPCVLLPENPLFLTVCHFPGVQRSHDTRNRNILKCQLHKMQKFRYRDTHHERAVRAESLNIILIITVCGVNVIVAVPLSRVQYNDFTSTDSFYITTGVVLKILCFLTKCMYEKQKTTTVECMLQSEI